MKFIALLLLGFCFYLLSVNSEYKAKIEIYKLNENTKFIKLSCTKNHPIDDKIYINTNKIQDIIKISRATYSGNCPCPYDLDSAGRFCGGRSAYEQRRFNPNSVKIFCYENDFKGIREI